MNESILIKIQQKLQEYEALLVFSTELHLWEKSEVLRLGEAIYDILEYLEKNNASHSDYFFQAEHLLAICFFHAGFFDTAHKIFKRAHQPLKSNILFYQILNDLLYFQYDCPENLKFKTKLSILDALKKLSKDEPLHRYLLSYAWHSFDMPMIAQIKLMHTLKKDKEQLLPFHKGMYFSMSWAQLNWNVSWIKKIYQSWT